MDAALDDGRLAVSNDWDCARQLVGLLRTRLGRLVVLGSGRERVLHAMVGWHCADSFARRYRAAWAIQELDLAARDFGVFAESPGHFPGALGHSRFGARVRIGSDARLLYPDFSGHRSYWCARAVCLACSCNGFDCRFRPVIS